MSDILDRLRAARENAPTIPLEIPEWEITAYIKPVSTAKHAAISKDKDHGRMVAKFIIACLMDESGKPLFEDNAESLAEIQKQDAGLIAWIGGEVLGTMNARFEDAKNS